MCTVNIQVIVRPPSRSAEAQTVLGIILGGGAGSRLYPLTKKRAKPAVPLGANYRLIDIPVSNCINSNVNKIYCLTQVPRPASRGAARAGSTALLPATPPPPVAGWGEDSQDSQG